MITTPGLYITGGGSVIDPSLLFNIIASFPGESTNILNVTSVQFGNTIAPGQIVAGVGMPIDAAVLPYGTQGTTGAGSTGTYALSVYGDNVNSESMQMTASQFGQAGAGSLYFDAYSLNLYNRNTTNTAWNTIGLTTLTNLGLLPRAGAALTAAITGSSGLLTADGNTPFTAPPYVISKQSQAATLADISNLQTSLVAQINSEVNQAIQSIGFPSIKSNFAFGYGQVGIEGSTSIIYYPLPLNGLTYPDGSLVATADCYGFATPSETGSNGTSNTTTLFCIPSQTVPNGMSWASYEINAAGGQIYSYTMNYIIIAIKPTA